MSCVKINHVETAIKRLITQFKESPNLIGYITALLLEADVLEQTFIDLCTLRWIDTAEGVNLDIIGEIVGQERGFTQAVAEPFFGFKGAIGSGTFGTSGDPLIGAKFRSISNVEYIDVIWDDATYRTFIRAKIQKNKTRVTINEVIDIVLRGVTSVTTVQVIENQADFRLKFPGLLTDDEKLLLTRTTYTPKPAGVSVSYEDDDGVFV